MKRNSQVAPQRESEGTVAKRGRYHHGALRDALLSSAACVLRRDGFRGLTLRAIAREAGVTHTATQRHFPDMSGVLSELAAMGHRSLAASMAGRARDLPHGTQRKRAIARGYIDFAVENPDLFRLMSRNELLDPTWPSLVAARHESARGLMDVFGPTTIEPDSTNAPFPEISPHQAIEMTAAWGYVHGLATLLIDGTLVRLAASAKAEPFALVDSAIEQMNLVSRDSNR